MASLTCCLPGVPRSAPRAKVDGLRTRHAPLCVTVRRCRLPPASALQRRDNGGGPVKPYLSLFQKTPSWEEIDELSGGSECLNHELSRLALERLISAARVRSAAGLLGFFACVVLVVLRLSEGHLFDNVPGGLTGVIAFGTVPAYLPVALYFHAHNELKSAIEQALHDRN